MQLVFVKGIISSVALKPSGTYVLNGQFKTEICNTINKRTLVVLGAGERTINGRSFPAANITSFAYKTFQLLY